MSGESLSIRLSAIETLQREGHALDAHERGMLAAARRHGDAELKARVEAVEMIEARRAARRAKRQTEDADQ